MLTEMQIKNSRPKEKRYLLHDEHGLYLQITPAGGRSWKFRFWKEGKEKKLTIGDYPLVSLKEARVLRDKLRMQMLEGQAPSLKTPDPDEEDAGKGKTFFEVYEEWVDKKVLPTLAPDYANDIAGRARNHILPFIGDLPIEAVSKREILVLLRRIEAKGNTHMAKRVRQICGRVFRFGSAAGYCDIDPTSALSGAMQSHVTKNNPTITDPARVGMLMRAIDAYPGKIVRVAMQVHAYTFVRPGELRKMEWAEIDWEKKRWEIPGEKMKLRRAHVVPLSRQVLALIEGIRAISEKMRYVFPSARSPKGDRPLSEAAELGALRAMGFQKEVITPHGFRSMASTLLNENGWNPDWIEMQLAHAQRNTIRGTYNRAQYWDGRAEMMQWYADYLDQLRDNTST